MSKISFFTDYLSFKSPKAFGVDFNNDTIKVLQLEHVGNHHKIIGWNKKNMPKGVINNFEITQADKLLEVFIDCIREAKGKIKGNSIVLSVPENKVFIRIITIPVMEQEEAYESVKWETESNIPIAIDEVFFDWQIVEKGKDNMKVLVLACPKKVVENYIQTFEKVGFNVVALEAESIATGRCVLEEKDSSSTIIIDMGSISTSYAIYQKGFPVFASSSSISGKMITDCIAKGLGAQPDKAESLKIKTGLGVKNKEDTQMMTILQPILANLVSEIQRAINFYEERMITKPEEKVEKIILCGGGSNLKGLVSYLTINLKNMVTHANPWGNMHLGGNLPPISMEDAQGFITAIGLALRAQEYEDYD